MLAINQRFGANLTLYIIMITIITNANENSTILNA
jgi:hypothetical protein